MIAQYHFPERIREVNRGQYEVRCACGFVDARPTPESAQSCWGHHLDVIFAKHYVTSEPDLDGILKRGPGARRSDPLTSKKAVPKTIGRIAAAVLLRLHQGPITDEELIPRVVKVTGCAESSPRKRRGELADNGYVQQVGLATSSFDKDMTLWGLTPKGLSYVIAHFDVLAKKVETGGRADREVRDS